MPDINKQASVAEIHDPAAHWQMTHVLMPSRLTPALARDTLPRPRVHRGNHAGAHC
jgi:hypothetical protein